MSLESQLSVKKSLKSATQRLEALETEVPKIVAGVNNGFSNLEARFNETSDTLTACVQLLGEKEVAAKVQENRIARAEAIVSAQKEGLDKAILDGKVAYTDVIGEKSVIVCKETDPNGNPVTPSRVQLEFRQIKPDFQPKFLGFGPGTKVTTPNGNILEVDSVYDIVDPPPPAANADVAAPAQDGPVATPEVVAQAATTDAAAATQAPAQA